MHIPAETVYKLAELVHTCITSTGEAEAGKWAFLEETAKGRVDFPEEQNSEQNI